MAIHRQIYTTKQAAELLGVSLPTVVNWIKKGLIDAYKTPGGHRRISYSSLSSFMAAHGYPAANISPILGGAANMAVVLTMEKDLGELLREWLELKLNMRTTIVTSIFMSGVEIGRNSPAVFIIDATTVNVQLHDLVRKIMAGTLHREVGVVIISGPMGVPDPPPNSTVLRQPLNLEDLKLTVEEIIGTRIAAER